MKKKMYLAGRVYHTEQDRLSRDYRVKFVNIVNDSVLADEIELVYPIDYYTLTAIKTLNGSFSSSIVNIDLKYIYNSDILFAYYAEDLLDKYTYPYIGTSMETMYAHKYNKFIFTVINEYSSDDLKFHPFLRHFSDICITDDIEFKKTLPILQELL